MSMGFDKIASLYGILESFLFGSKLQQMRCAYLDQLADVGCVLLIGEGTGSFLERLLKVNSKVAVTVVESSSGMIDRSRNRVASKDLCRVSFHRTTLLDFDSIQSFDAVCTFFFWDCFEEYQLRMMLPAFSKYAKHGSLWIDVDFFELSEGLPKLNLHHFLLIRMLYGFFGLATGIEAKRIVEIEPMAKQNGFFVTESRTDEKFPIRARIFRRTI